MRLLRPPLARIATGENPVPGSRRPHAATLARLDERQMRALRGNEIGFIFQEPMTSLNPLLPVGRQIAQAIRLHRPLSAQAAAAQAVGLLERVDIRDAGRRSMSYPHQLSGGMRQRVMIAMALACSPVLLLADEPTTALDVTVQAQILRLIRDCSASSAWGCCSSRTISAWSRRSRDHVEVMYGGQIVESAPVHDLFDRPRHPYTRALLDSLPDADAPHRPHQRLRVVPGQVVDPRNPPPGCRLRTALYHVDGGLSCRSARGVGRPAPPTRCAACAGARPERAAAAGRPRVGAFRRASPCLGPRRAAAESGRRRELRGGAA